MARRVTRFDHPCGPHAARARRVRGMLRLPATAMPLAPIAVAAGAMMLAPFADAVAAILVAAVMLVAPSADAVAANTDCGPCADPLHSRARYRVALSPAGFAL